MVCLETDFLVALLRKDKSAITKLETIEGILSITIISLAELYRGAYLSRDPTKEVSKIEKLLYGIKLFHLDENSAKMYGLLHSQLKSTMIRVADLLIASIVLTNRDVLITKDEHFSRVPKLRTETW